MKKGFFFALVISVSALLVSIVFAQKPEAPINSPQHNKPPMSEVAILLTKQSIIDTLAEYSFAWDGDPLNPAGSPVNWADCFTEGGIFEAIATDGKVLDHWEGRKELIAGARALGIGSKKMNDPWKMKHLMQQVIWDEITPTTAMIRVSAIMPVVDNKSETGSVTSVPMGVYYDKWVKTEAGWKLSHRTFRFDVAVSMPHGTAEEKTSKEFLSN